VQCISSVLEKGPATIVSFLRNIGKNFPDF
jgi:hypothetical protein